MGHLNNTDDWVSVCIDGYISGAHSRDEEVKELEQALAFTEDVVDVQKKELSKLRNPWISVEKHPTDVTKDYLLEYEDGSHIIAIWDSGMWMSKGLHPLKEPTKWMPIPEI